ncbi:helix-turn-helix domain-containing protein [Microbacterium sp. P07]|uniref:helix-turn-helix domain-containing protein n=1 Tax=Microbacterium sp. P07 TaxID=3366952 RepID=UPI0037452AD0
MRFTPDEIVQIADMVSQRVLGTVHKNGFTRDQAAEYTGLSIYKIKTAIRDNTLPARQHGKDIIILRGDLDLWMKTWPVA